MYIACAYFYNNRAVLPSVTAVEREADGHTGQLLASKLSPGRWKKPLTCLSANEMLVKQQALLMQLGSKLVLC